MRAKIQKKFLLLPIILIIPFAILSACGGQPTGESGPAIPIPPVIITEGADYNGIQVSNQGEEIIPPELDIPLFNEYVVTLEFDPATRIFDGITSIHYTNHTGFALEELVFRLPLNAWSENASPPLPYPAELYHRIFRHGRDYGHMDILHVSKDNEELFFIMAGTILTVPLTRPLEPEDTIQIRIQFEAYVPKIAHRTGANDQAIWAGAFLPVVAVFGQQGWHLEAFYPVGSPFIQEAANYTVSITTPLGYVVAGTGLKTEVDTDEQRVTTFNIQMTRDFAFAISPHFQRVSKMTPTGREINLYHYTLGLPTEHILNVAVEAMTFFENTVGAYPYPQLSIVETDMFVSGENFSSVIFMDSNHLQTNRNLTSLRKEIGRQWFSVIVGSNPIEEAWLNGGLTLFLQEGLLGRSIDLRSVVERDHSYLRGRLPFIREEDSRRIATRIHHYNSWDDYFRVQHRKAGIMFYALYREMGALNFRSLLREYYGQFAFRIAEASDFISLAEEIHSSSLESFFDYWLNTTGLPELVP